jgi:transcriptional regulator with PAS, ATPase and Fis domain
MLLLTNYFIKKFSEKMNRPAPSFSDNALQALKTYAWPGNKLMRSFSPTVHITPPKKSSFRQY